MNTSLFGGHGRNPIGQHLTLFHSVTWYIHNHIMIPCIVHAIFQRDIGIEQHQGVEDIRFSFKLNARLLAHLQ